MRIKRFKIKHFFVLFENNALNQIKKALFRVAQSLLFLGRNEKALIGRRYYV